MRSSVENSQADAVPSRFTVRTARGYSHVTSCHAVGESSSVPTTGARLGEVTDGNHGARGMSGMWIGLPQLAASARRAVGAVDPAYSSQICSGRGVLVERGL